MSTGAREFKDEFVKSLSFQMVVVPSVLALIGLWVGDSMQEPELATLLTFGLMVLFFVLYWWNWSRRRRMHRQRTLVDGSRVHRSYPGLVFAPSILQPDGEVRFRCRHVVVEGVRTRRRALGWRGPRRCPVSHASLVLPGSGTDRPPGRRRREPDSAVPVNESIGR